MLCSPPPATTLASSCAGSEGFCAPCCRRSSQRSRIHNRPKTGRTLLLHERLACLERSPDPVAVDCDAVHHPVLAVGLADELPKKNWTGQPPLIFPVVVPRRSPVNQISNV